MQDLNTHGREAPKSKTINVEVDLLAEWSAEKNRLREQCTRTLALLFALALLGALTLPSLQEAFVDAKFAAAKAEKRAQAAGAELEKHRAQTEQVAPRLAQEDLSRTSQRSSRAFLGQVAALMAAAGNGVAFSSVRSDVLGGEITQHISADAVSFDAARAFAERAAKGPGVKDAVRSSTRPNEALAAGGVKFEFRVRATVTP